MREFTVFWAKLAQTAAFRRRLAGLAATLLLIAAAPETLPAREAAEAPPKLGRATGAPLPRFASLRRVPARLRRGPGTDYPIDWELTQDGLPVQIFSEHDHWRRVRLHDGSTGWIHKALLSGRRTALLIGTERELYAAPEDGAPPALRVEGVLPLKLLRCGRKWCEAEAENERGWAQKRRLWGVGPDEILE